MSGRHRFRFFVDVVGAPGELVPLAPIDARHVHVLRMAEGDCVEAVDAAGAVWAARVTGDAAVELVEQLGSSTEPATTIELYAGALTGSKFDELVDAAVQAGAASITPVVASGRELERLRARRARLERIARAAAKQAKRSRVPAVFDPILADALADEGIIVDPGAPQPLDEVVAAAGHSTLRLLVGGAEGIAPELVARLVDRGWRRARLGPTILRSELAAPIAVAIAAMATADS